jgi:hypothetical protein
MAQKRKFMPREYGPSQFRDRLRGLVKAAKTIKAEKDYQKTQLEMFDKLKPEDQQYRM